jgi:amidase
VRIGVVRELFDKTTLTPAVHETVDLIDRALVDLAGSGAQIVDPGPGNALLASSAREYAPKLAGHLFTAEFPDLFPVDAAGKPVGDHGATLVGLILDPSKVPENFSFMSLPRGAAEGENKFSMNL